MKVLFLPWSQASHYFQLVPLAWARGARGPGRRPGEPDYVANADLLVRTGAGQAMDWDGVSTAAISAATAAVLTGDSRQAAARLKEENDTQPAPADLVSSLGSLARRRAASRDR